MAERSAGMPMPEALREAERRLRRFGLNEPAAGALARASHRVNLAVALAVGREADIPSFTQLSRTRDWKLRRKSLGLQMRHVGTEKPMSSINWCQDNGETAGQTCIHVS